MLAGDGRSSVDVDLLGDARARHFWDGERVVGRWLADARVAGATPGGIVWDAFYVFGPDAVWNEKPGPVASYGAPVISEKATLEAKLTPFLD